MLTDRDLREMLRTIEPGDEPSPEFFSSLYAAAAAARPTSSRRRPRWFSGGLLGSGRPPALAWYVVALLLAAIVIGALVAGALRTEPFPRIRQAEASLPGAPETEQLRVGFRATLPGPPDSIAVDPAQGVWVATGGRLVRLNLINQSVSAPVQLGGAPNAMAFDTSWVYVISREAGRLMKVDYVSGDVISAVPVTDPVALALDTSVDISGAGGRVAGQSASPVRGPGLLIADGADRSLIELDSGTLAERWRVAVPATPIMLAEGGGHIWVAARPADDPTALVLIVYEAGTGHLQGTVRLHSNWGTPRSFAVSQTAGKVGFAWVPDPASGAVAVVDPERLSVTETVDIGPNVTDAFLRPGGSIVLAFAGDAASPLAVNALAVVDPRTDAVRRYIVRRDSPGSGRGVLSLTSDQFADGSCCNSVVWHVWFAMDWDGDPSVGRVDTAELP